MFEWQRSGSLWRGASGRHITPQATGERSTVNHLLPQHEAGDTLIDTAINTAPTHTVDRGTIDWVNLSFIVLSPLACAIALPLYIAGQGVQVIDFACMALMIGLTGLAITAGYHRHFSHRSYECSPLIKAFYLAFGAAAMQAPVIEWVGKHRDHHRFVDRDGDPYSIKRGFFWAHIGWTFRHDLPGYTGPALPDLEQDRMVRFFNRHHLAAGAVVGIGVPFAIGLCFGRPFGGVLWGSLLRVVLAHHSTFLVNSAAHCFGRQPYTTRNSARDSLLVALLTLGEGYHNFHHAFPADYRNGRRWYQWDPTKWWIIALRSIGLARNLYRTPAERIARALEREAARRAGHAHASPGGQV
jgi:stearoyl-CoA desaturase (Delta-9 desaturase)